MKYDDDHQSDDLIDRRGDRAPGGGGRGLGGAMAFVPMLLRTKYGWVILLLLLGVGLFKGGLQGLLGGGASDSSSAVTNTPARVSDKPAHFVAFVLDDIQSTWDGVLAEGPVRYRHAKLVLFTNRTSTGCGMGEAQTGPFYCPEDERAYIDLGFYDELSQKLGARGDFAQAYVIAHEIGHHVQKVLGISDKVHEAPRGAVKGSTGLSVRMELQADCFAGIWAKGTEQRKLLEAGDIDEALGAAASVGDDRLQKQAQGAVQPETFTHGTSEQRSRWFRRGYEQGSIEACNTFRADPL